MTRKRRGVGRWGRFNKIMSETFNCPNCTASLDHDGGDHLTVQCAYCDTTVIVPESLRPQAYKQNFEPLLAHSNDLQQIVQLINQGKADEAVALFQQSYGLDHDEAADGVQRLAAGLRMETANIRIDLPKKSRRGCWVGCLIWLIAMFGSVIVVPYLVLSQGGETPIDEVMGRLINEEGEFNVALLGTLVPAEALEGVTGSETAVVRLVEMGGRGINPGQFNDARALAVDRNGLIYVADRESGRLQTFDRNGEPQAMWVGNDDTFTDDLEINGEGVLYAQQQGKIYRYDGATGTPLGEVVYTGDVAVVFDDLALTADGELYAINRVRNTIVHFGTEGELLNTIDLEAIPEGERFTNLTVDGLGNLYVTGTAKDLLGDRQDVVFRFTPEGQFAAQFGSSGNEPGTFQGIVSSIAVDGQGRVYVGDFQGIHVFDNNGRFLELISIDGVANDIAFNPQGELAVISNQHILYLLDVSGIRE